ncbi:MAG TPA: hypothetical protein VGR40_09770, partial [Candidatus Binatus sp.]|nr:hypothetical protein [Candidatus Binatus sp.]
MAASIRAHGKLRLVRCLMCRQPMTFEVSHQNGGACPLCIAERAELRWRTVYDRKNGVGEIPANLRATYRL